MADIFISYAREDRAVAALLASALERRGWSVWWDRIIPPGKTFDEVIEMELASARCAIVLWSKTAVLSRWVRDEAQAAINAHKLLPAILDGVEPPMGFRRIQAADLAGWRGDDVHSGWQDLRDAADDMLALSHGERVESAQNLEPPQSTHAYSTTKPPDAKKNHRPASPGAACYHAFMRLYSAEFRYLYLTLYCCYFDPACGICSAFLHLECRRP